MQNISKETIIKAAGGDIEAFEDIYKVFSGYVYAIAYRVLGNKEDAEEVSQDVFVKIYRNLHKFNFRSALKTWIYRITTNVAINMYKKTIKHKKRNVEYDDTIFSEKNKGSKVEKIEIEDKERTIKKMLEILPVDQKMCIVLKDIEGLSYEEISKALGVKLNTVRTRLKRAREKLIFRFRTRRDLYEV